MGRCGLSSGSGDAEPPLQEHTEALTIVLAAIDLSLWDEMDGAGVPGS